MTTTITQRSHLAAGIWRIADPKITLASASSLFLGLCAAADDGRIAWAWALITVLGIFFLEAAKNASGELFDFDSGADLAVRPEDRSPFSGGKRVLVDGLLTRAQTAGAALVFYLLGCVAGFLVVGVREPRVLLIGAIGVALAFFYHAPPLRLSYRGLGELAVALAYGPLIACGAYLVQRGTVSRTVVLASVPLGLLIAAFLWINEFPDCEADRSAGKRTLVVRLGRPAASKVFAAIVIGAFAVLAILPAFGAPFGIWGGFLGLPLAVKAAFRLRQEPEVTAQIIPAQEWTLLSFLLFAAGAGAGLLLS
ncbi:MAG TPA: prenyltransferase [Myxococcales bacterium]|nr:prenyltransferase [Myxococcales bacterium]